jgi:hypothetical protein
MKNIDTKFQCGRWDQYVLEEKGEGITFPNWVAVPLMLLWQICGKYVAVNVDKDKNLFT